MLTKIILITVEDGGGLIARVKLVMGLLESWLYEFHRLPLPSQSPGRLNGQRRGQLLWKSQENATEISGWGLGHGEQPGRPSITSSMDCCKTLN